MPPGWRAREPDDLQEGCGRGRLIEWPLTKPRNGTGQQQATSAESRRPPAELRSADHRDVAPVDVGAGIDAEAQGVRRLGLDGHPTQRLVELSDYRGDHRA